MRSETAGNSQRGRQKSGCVVKDYQEVRDTLINMLEELEKSLEDVPNLVTPIEKHSNKKNSDKTQPSSVVEKDNPQ